MMSVVRMRPFVICVNPDGHGLLLGIGHLLEEVEWTSIIGQRLTSARCGVNVIGDATHVRRMACGMLSTSAGRRVASTRRRTCWAVFVLGNVGRRRANGGAGKRQMRWLPRSVKPTPNQEWASRGRDDYRGFAGALGRAKRRSRVRLRQTPLPAPTMASASPQERTQERRRAWQARSRRPTPRAATDPRPASRSWQGPS